MMYACCTHTCLHVYMHVCMCASACMCVCILTCDIMNNETSVWHSHQWQDYSSDVREVYANFTCDRTMKMMPEVCAIVTCSRSMTVIPERCMLFSPATGRREWCWGGCERSAGCVGHADITESAGRWCSASSCCSRCSGWRWTAWTAPCHCVAGPQTSCLHPPTPGCGH